MDESGPSIPSPSTDNGKRRPGRPLAESLNGHADPDLEHKRLKARERQRRKRARDRAGITTNRVNGSDDMGTQNSEDDERKDKIRKAARERQRKHRAIVKAKKLSVLGGPLPPGLEAYADDPNLGYPQDPGPSVHSDDTGDPQSGSPYAHQTQPQAPSHIFANTLLLALSCAPVLKTTLLRAFSLTGEDIPSLQHTLAAAFDHWNNEVSSQG
jgi:hypothetical protein